MLPSGTIEPEPASVSAAPVVSGGSVVATAALAPAVVSTVASIAIEIVLLRMWVFPLCRVDLPGGAGPGGRVRAIDC